MLMSYYIICAELLQNNFVFLQITFVHCAAFSVLSSVINVTTVYVDKATKIDRHTYSL